MRQSPDLLPSALKIGTTFTPALRSIHTNFGFSITPFRFFSNQKPVCDRQTDGQTYRQHP